MAPGFTPRKKRFAALLKEARTNAEMSQERAAREVGTSRRHWIRWESGETMPNEAYLARIAKVLDESALLEFVSDEDDEERQMLTIADFLEALQPFADLVNRERERVA